MSRMFGGPIFYLPLFLCLTPPAFAIAVFDAAALSENILHRVLYLDQWARDNLTQANQLSSLNLGNDIIQGTQDLMSQNYAMDFKETWEQITSLQEDTLVLLHASKSAWEEFGSLGQYLASFYKADAWEKCLADGNCDFQEVVQKLDDEAIVQALNAYRHADEMNVKLASQVQELQKLGRESQNSQSAAGTLDALSKINGAVADSLVDLNSQVALLTKLQSQALAQEKSKDRSRAARDEILLRYDGRYQGKVPAFLPETDYSWPY